MQKVIVTGGAGFIGSNLVDCLIQMGTEVIILDDLSTGKKENLNPKATFYNIDISKLRQGTTLYKDIVDKMDGVDTIFHLAALARVQPSIEDPIPFDNVNISGTLNILCLAKDIKVNRVVYSASSSCYGNNKNFPTPETELTNPLSPYGLQKYVGEQYCKMFSEVYGLDTVSLRYFNIYGERMNLDGAYCLVMGIFAKQMLEGKPLSITNDGEQKRDFTYVGDACNANILAALHKDKLHGESFNIGNGKNYTINEVADMMGGEKVYGEKRIEPFQTLADNSKAKEILGWTPQGNLLTWIKKYKEELGL